MLKVIFISLSLFINSKTLEQVIFSRSKWHFFIFFLYPNNEHKTSFGMIQYDMVICSSWPVKMYVINIILKLVLLFYFVIICSKAYSRVMPEYMYRLSRWKSSSQNITIEVCSSSTLFIYYFNVVTILSLLDRIHHPT